MQPHSSQIINDFYSKFFHIFFNMIILTMFNTLYSKDDRKDLLQNIFDKTMESFDGFFKDAGVDNAEVIMDIKKGIHSIFDNIKKDMKIFRNEFKKINKK